MALNILVQLHGPANLHRRASSELQKMIMQFVSYHGIIVIRTFDRLFDYTHQLQRSSLSEPKPCLCNTKPYISMESSLVVFHIPLPQLLHGGV